MTDPKPLPDLNVMIGKWRRLLAEDTDRGSVVVALDHLTALLARLDAAEKVCAAFSVLGVDQTARGKAATQAWMDWSEAAGVNLRLSGDDEAALVARRDAIQAATLARLNSSQTA